MPLVVTVVAAGFALLSWTTCATVLALDAPCERLIDRPRLPVIATSGRSPGRRPRSRSAASPAPPTRTLVVFVEPPGAVYEGNAGAVRLRRRVALDRGVDRAGSQVDEPDPAARRTGRSSCSSRRSCSSPCRWIQLRWPPARRRSARRHSRRSCCCRSCRRSVPAPRLSTTMPQPVIPAPAVRRMTVERVVRDVVGDAALGRHDDPAECASVAGWSLVRVLFWSLTSICVPRRCRRRSGPRRAVVRVLFETVQVHHGSGVPGTEADPVHASPLPLSVRPPIVDAADESGPSGSRSCSRRGSCSCSRR